MARRFVEILANTLILEVKPPLHIFLMLLGLRRRPRGDPMLIRLIRENYCRKLMLIHEM